MSLRDVLPTFIRVISYHIRIIFKGLILILLFLFFNFRSIKMLKWSVNKRTETTESLAPIGCNGHARRSLGNVIRTRPTNLNNNNTNKNNRRSLGANLNIDKENRFTSTPYSLVRAVTPSYVKYDSIALRDVSNLSPAPASSTPTSRKRPLLISPIATSVFKKQNPPQYASTLPSFDIEYSPCEIKSTQFFPLKGLEVADSYYGNPRYFPDDQPPSKRIKSIEPQTFVTPLTTRLSELRFNRINLKSKNCLRNINNNNLNEETLSSSVMSDTTLEKMIDAILESTSKKVPINDSEIMLESPTYTAAEDPAIDLEKYIDVTNKTIILEETTVLNEREVRTPDSILLEKKSIFQNVAENSPCHLIRMKAVRRKHKTENFVGLTLPNGIPSPDTPESIFCNNTRLRKSFDILAEMDTPTINHSYMSKHSDEFASEINSLDLQACSTPTSTEDFYCETRRCLTFSPELREDSLSKRQSVTSSCCSRLSKSTVVKGSLDVGIAIEDNKLKIHGECMKQFFFIYFF